MNQLKMNSLKKITILLLCLNFAMCKKAQKIEDLKINTTKTKEIKALDTILQSVAWETGLDKENFDLYPFKQRKFAGVLTTFSRDSIFETGYVAPCGNDDFWAKHGKYKLLSDNKIAIQIDSISFWGMDTRPTKYPKELTIYTLTKKDSTFILSKQ